jgi:hypothetical protein
LVWFAFKIEFPKFPFPKFRQNSTSTDRLGHRDSDQQEVAGSIPASANWKLSAFEQWYIARCTVALAPRLARAVRASRRGCACLPRRRVHVFISRGENTASWK